MDTVLETVPAWSCECFGVLQLECFGGAWHFCAVFWRGVAFLRSVLEGRGIFVQCFGGAWHFGGVASTVLGGDVCSVLEGRLLFGGSAGRVLEGLSLSSRLPFRVDHAWGGVQ